MTKAQQFFNLAAPKLEYLHDRWQDEQKYEDFSDYKKTIEPLAQQTGVTFIKLTKKPFACHFKSEGKSYQIVVTAKRCALEEVL